jgi:hypothetical protein
MLQAGENFEYRQNNPNQQCMKNHSEVPISQITYTAQFNLKKNGAHVTNF